MERTSRSIVGLALVAVAFAAAQACAGETDPETRSEVPAFTALHEVVFPLWHEAWPKKDYAMMKQLLPQARAGVAKVGEARRALAVTPLPKRLASREATARAVEAVHAQYEKVEGLLR